MKKIALILAIVTTVLFLFGALIFGVCLFEIYGSNNDWATLILAIYAYMGLIALVILTIPFILILIKEGMKQVKLYFYTHIVFAALIIAMVTVVAITA